MDYTITPAPRRGWVRRLSPWVASLGLFAGGGYGVYRYAAPTMSGDRVAAAPPAETSADRLLAAMPQPAGAATGRYTTPFDAPAANPMASRYAPPTLPPASADEVATPRDAAAVSRDVNPFASMPAVNGGYADRYSAATSAAPPASETPAPETPAAETPAAEPAAQGSASAAEEPAVAAAPSESAGSDLMLPPSGEVARGQEPQSPNPLRSGSRAAATTADAADEARAAFGGSPTTDTLPEPPAADAGHATPLSNAPPARSFDASGLGPADGSRYAPIAGAGAPSGPPAPAELAASSTAVGGSSAALSAAPGAPPAPYGAGPLPPYRTAASEQAATIHAAPTPASAYPQAAGGFDAAITPTPGLATADGSGRPGDRALEGLQTPSLTIQKLAPPEVQIGKKATFALRIQNNSQRTVHNVVVTDEAPLGAQLVGTAPKAAVSGSRVTWDLGALSVGEERVVEMELMPTQEGELGSVATVTFATQASAKTRCTRPQLALRLTSSPQVMIGETQIVQIEVTNPGTGDATGVMLLESVPEGVTHEAGPALELEVGTLHPGETRRLDLVLSAKEAGLIDNVMTARADANLQVQANCQFEIVAPALKVSVEGPTRRILERPATYTVSVDNPGTATAREVQLVTQLPKGLQFVSANNYGEYDAATHSVYWSLKELPANEHGTVELTALAVEPGDHTLQFATRAQQGLEDRAETQVRVEGIVALSFEVQDLEDAIEVGGETAYEIRVRNQGTKTAANVQVVAAMPPGLRAQAAQADSRYTIQGDRVVFAPLAQLAPKTEATFQFRVQGLRSGDQRVQLQVTTDEVRDPIVEIESTQVYADE